MLIVLTRDAAQVNDIFSNNESDYDDESKDTCSNNENDHNDEIIYDSLVIICICRFL